MVYLQRWHGWCHMKLQPSRSCVHHTTMLHVTSCKAAVDHVGTEAWRDLPDMHKGDHGKLAAPAQRQRKAANNGQEAVAAVLAALEAAVGGGPHAVDAVGVVWFGQYILKGHLEQSTRHLRLKTPRGNS